MCAVCKKLSSLPIHDQDEFLRKKAGSVLVGDHRLNQTDSACALGDLAVAEAVYSRADQACGHCTRSIDATISPVPRSALAVYVELLESNHAAIKAEWQHAVELASGNPNAGAFFQVEKDSLAERRGDWREVELFRREWTETISQTKITIRPRRSVATTPHLIRILPFDSIVLLRRAQRAAVCLACCDSRSHRCLGCCDTSRASQCV